MKNRYTDKLLDGNQQILAVTPGNQTLRMVAAYEFSKIYKKGQRVIDLGCGEGDSAIDILNLTDVELDVLDQSEGMINLAKKNLEQFKGRVNFICEDALEYLEKADAYDVISSQWTIHNFPQEDKISILKAIYKNLKPNGTFILMDKVYTEAESEIHFNKQMKRYSYLEEAVAKDIIDHEKQDFTKEYIMLEKSFLESLKDIGFRNIEIVDRVERDIVLIANK